MAKVLVDIKVNPSFKEVSRKFRSVNIPKASQEGLEEYAFLTERFAKISSPIDTGRLRSSITTDIGNLRARISPHVHYAIYVHEGTKFMRARPFLSIGLQQAQARLFSGRSPFETHLQRELDSKIK